MGRSSIHHPQVGVVIAQVQHSGNIARVAVLKGDYAVGRIARGPPRRRPRPTWEAHGLGMGEERLEGDVGKGTLHALIGGAVLAQHLGLVIRLATSIMFWTWSR